MKSISRLAKGACAVLAAAFVLTGPANAQDTVRVGSTPSGVPFTFLDVKTNQIEGVMVDIVRAIGEKEALTPQVEATQWSALIPSLTGNKIDIIAAAMYATEERAKVVAFSEPVYSYGEGLFVNKDDTGSYKNWDDLEGKTIGAQVGTAYVGAMQDSGKFKEVRVYDNIADIMRDVSLGRLDAGFGDRPIVAYRLKTEASKDNVRLVEEYESQITGNVALAVRQDDTELLAKLNDGIAKITESGELQQIIDKWGIE